MLHRLGEGVIVSITRFVVGGEVFGDHQPSAKDRDGRSDRTHLR